MLYIECFKLIYTMSNTLKIHSPKLIEEIHPTMNFGLELDCLTYGSKKKIWWLGKCGHIWQATVSDRTRGKGCRICKYVINGENKRKSLLINDNTLEKINPLAAKIWHPNLNDLTPDKISPNSNKKVWWFCDICSHSWKAVVANIHRRSYKGNGCPACHGLVVTDKNCLENLRPDLAKEWSPENCQTPREVTCNSTYQANWICSLDKKHTWKANVNNRNYGAGCPQCKKKTQTLLYQIVKKLLPDCKVYYDYKKSGLKYNETGKRMELDIFISKYNLALEYQGEQHFGLRKDLLHCFPKQIKRDEEKRNACLKIGIKLIEIHYSWNKSEEEIIKLLDPFIKNE